MCHGVYSYNIVEFAGAVGVRVLSDETEVLRKDLVLHAKPTSAVISETAKRDMGEG